MFHNVLIDGLNLLFRAQNVAPFLTSTLGTPTGTLVVMLNMLGRIRKDHPTATLYFVWDGSPQRRKTLYPEYKSRRPPGREVARPEVPLLLASLGIHQVVNADEEADDVIYTLAKTMRGNTLIVSTDRDILQCCTLTTILQTGTVKKPHHYDAAAVKQEYGVVPEKFALYRCFVGDSSDDLQGVPHMLKKLAASFAEKYPDVASVYASLADHKLTKKQRASLLQYRTQVEVNERLCHLVEVPYTLREGRLDRGGVEEQLQQLDINVKVVKPFFEVPAGFKKTGFIRTAREGNDGKLPDTDGPRSFDESLDDGSF